MNLTSKKLFTNVRKVFVSFLCFSFFVQQLVFIPVLADPVTPTNITGVTGNSGVYDINPSQMSGNTGFRQYTDFHLSEGDVANLIFKYGEANVARFVNMVDNRIVINGILNSMQNGSFYNGNAIFVSPNGMVVGASGVINVGSLTAIAPNKATYDAFNTKISSGFGGVDVSSNEAAITTALGTLRTASQGDITVNGKIFARGNVDLHAKSINIGSDSTSNTSTGVFAGVQSDLNKDIAGKENAITSSSQAKQLFDALVSHDPVPSGAKFALNDGKIVITAKSGILQTGKKESSMPNLADNQTIDNYIDDAGQVVSGAGDFLVDTLVADKANLSQNIEDSAATVNIKNAYLGAKDINVSATSDTLYRATADSVGSILDQLILDDQVTSDDLDNFFTGPFDDFVGARAKAEININSGAILEATNDVTLSSKAVATTQVKTPRATRINLASINGDPDELLYALGTQTVSNVNVNSGSKIEAGNNLNVSSLSKNSALVKMNNAGALKELDVLPNIQLSIINYTNKAETNARINSGTEVKAKNLNVQAVNVTNENIVIKNVGTYSPIKGVGTVSVALGALLKHDYVSTNAVVDSVIDTSKSGDVNVTAQNLLVSTANVASSAKQLTEEKPTKASATTKALAPVKSFQGKLKLLKNPELTDFIEGDPNKVDLSGSFIMNTENVTASATVGKNANIEANNVNVNANTINLTVNKASAASGKGETLSPGIAVIVNDQNTKSYAKIESGTQDKGAVVKANNNVNVSATTELPLNERTIDFIFTLADVGDDIYFGLSNDDSSEGGWNLSSLSGITDAAGNVLASFKPIKVGIKQSGIAKTYGLEGFLNNYAQSASGAGEGGVSVAGSMVYSNVLNDTVAEIGDYAKVTAGNDIIVNAANDVVYNNAAGVIKSLLNPNPVKASGSKGGLAGLGGSVLVSLVENNAKAKIGNNSEVVAQGNVGLYSGSEQFYVNVVATGATAQKTAFVGSVLVQDTTGTTEASIGSSKVTGKNVTVSAGKGAKMAHSIQAVDQFETLGTPDDLTIQAYLRYLSKQEAQSVKPDFSTLEPTTPIDVALDVWQAAQETLWNAQYEISPDEQAAYNKMTAIDAKITAGTALTEAEQNLVNERKLAIIGKADSATAPIYQFKKIDPLTGLLEVSAPTEIKDKVSSINIGGALAQQTDAVKVKEGAPKPKSSSGVAVGATVIVSQLNRSVSANVSDGAVINASESFNVTADTKSQGINVALAGAFAGGVNVKKEKQEDANGTDPSKNKDGNQKAQNAGGWLDKIQPILQKLGSKTDKAATKSPTPAGATNPNVLDKHGRPKLVIDNKEYVTDVNKQYYNPTTGEVLKDGDGKPVKYAGSLGEENQFADDAKKANSNVSLAAAGSVNAQINKVKTEAKVGNATINVGKTVNVTANQSSNFLDISGGVAKAGTVGAGAALNLYLNSGTTTASLGNGLTSASDNKLSLTYTGTGEKLLNVKASDEVKNLDIAIGVGVAKNTPDDTKTTVSVGGSFNISVFDENAVTAEIAKYASISDASGLDDINVNVVADNYTSLIKAAGGLAVSVPTSGSTAVGAGMTANVNAFDKKTSALINEATITNAKDVNVIVNSKTKDGKPVNTEDTISVGVAGSVITGGKAGYNFQGSIGTDIYLNTLNSKITGSDISSSGDVVVSANEYIRGINVAGALGFSAASKGVGFGLGTIVNVVNNSINSSIEDSSIIKSKNVKISAIDEEDLYLLGVNMGVQASGGSQINASGVVNVLISDINAGLIRSDIKDNSGTVDVLSNYDVDLYALTIAAPIAIGSGISVGANLVSNILLNNNISKVEESDINSVGKLTVKATSEESLILSPDSIAVTTSGSFAGAGNLTVNVVSNKTDAHISGRSDKKSKIKASGIEVSATDNTISRTRGGTIAASGGTAAVGGSIISDNYIKDIDAYIANAVITDGGAITVSAGAQNIFGVKDPAAITASALADKIKDKSFDIAKAADMLNWEMTFDASGAASAAVSGSLLSKIVINDVNSYIGSGVDIQKAGDIGVNAYNNTYVAGIVGNVTGSSGSAAVGGSVFSTVNVANVKAHIDSDATIGSSDSRVGAVTVSADSIQEYRTIMFVVGGSGSAAVNGSLNSNVIVNSTKAYIEKGIDLYAASLLVNSKDKSDIQSLNLAVSAGGSAGVGGIGYVNVLATKTGSTVGVEGVSVSTDKGIVDSTGNVEVKSKAEEDFSANMLSVAAGGTAAVNGILIATGVGSSVDASVKDYNIKATKVDVKAENRYNNPDKTANLLSFIKQKSDSAKNINKSSSDDEKKAGTLSGDEFSSTALVPLTTAVSVSGAGTAAVNGTVVANVISSQVNASVSDSIVTTSKDGLSGGLNISATSSATTYDVLAGVAGSATASVGVTSITNVIVSSTKALLKNTDVMQGNATVFAYDKMNLNGVLFMGSGAGEGAAVSAIANVNTVVNNLSAEVDTVNIKDGSLVVNALNDIDTTTVGVAIAGVGIGGGVAGIVMNNTLVGSQKATVKNATIDKGFVDVSVNNLINMNVAIVGGTLSGIGGAVGVYSPVNVVANSIEASVVNSLLKENTLSSVSVDSDIEAWDFAAVANISGIGASVSATAFVNVIDNDVNSFIKDSTITGGELTVIAEQKSKAEAKAFAANANGIGAGVGANLVTNVFVDRVNSYSQNSDFIDSSLGVSSKAEIEVDANVVQASGAGIGAGVNGSAIVNTVDNKLSSYVEGGSFKGIEDSTLSTKSINVKSLQSTLLTGTTGAAAVGAGAASAGAIVNVISNEASAYLSDMAIATTGDVIVDSLARETIQNYAIAASVGGFAGGLLANVNVIESSTEAYINSKTKNITAGNVSVYSEDIIASDNTTLIGSLGAVAASMGVTVNVVNNSVISELLSTDDSNNLTTSKISANNVFVRSKSTSDIDVNTSSLSVGMFGLSGALAVTSIGDRFSNPSSNESYLSGKNSDGSGTNVYSQAESTANNKQTTTSVNVSDNKGNTLFNKSYSSNGVSLVKSSGTKNEGTVSNVKANVDYSGKMDVLANNVSDVNVNNLSAALTYSASAGANILTTTSNYYTTAKISGGNINSFGAVDLNSTKNLNVNAQNVINAETNAAAGAAALDYGIAGNVAVFINNSVTQALISDSKINTNGKLLLNASNIDTITSTAISASAGTVALSANVAVSETNNTTLSNITGNVDISAADLDVTSSVQSQLNSELMAFKAGGVAINLAVNKVTSNSTTKAIIDAVGSVKVDRDLNVIAFNNGISATNSFYAGTFAIFNAAINYQGAFINSNFEAGINNNNLIVSSKDGGNVSNVSVLSGVKSDKVSAGDLSTTVIAKSSGGSLLSASVTAENAKINSDSVVNIKAKSLKARNLVAKSKLNRTASTGSVSNTIGGITLSGLILDADIRGNNTINIGSAGSNIAVSNVLSAELYDNAKAQNTMISANLSVLDVVVNKISNYVNTNTAVNVAGVVNTGTLDIDANVFRHSFSTAKQNTGALIALARTKMSSETLGTSLVDYAAVSNDSLFNNSIDINSIATNTTESYMTSDARALAALSRDETKNTVNTTNKVRFINSDIKSKGNVNASVQNVNQVAMTKESRHKAFLGVYGGKLTNSINSNVGVETTAAKIDAGNVSLSSKTGLNTLDSVMKYNDSTSGFISSSSIELANSISQVNNIDIADDTQIKASGNVNISLSNESEFDQAVDVQTSGGFGGGTARSPLSVSNTNTLNIKGGSDIEAGKQLSINFDSNNDLSTSAKVDSSAFAGNPSVSSYIYLTINNAVKMENGTNLLAGDLASINFMKNSRNVLDQYAYVYAQAAIATASWSGGIVYTNNNSIQIDSGAKFSSLRDVAINYMEGYQDFDSTVAYKKVSRALFGIPITKRGSSSRITKSYNNKLALNGQIEAGQGSNRILVIDKDGNVKSSETKGFTSSDYKTYDSSNVDSETTTNDAITALQSEIDAIKIEINNLKTQEKTTEIDSKIGSYTTLLANYTAILQNLQSGNILTIADVTAAMKSAVNSVGISADASTSFYSLVSTHSNGQVKTDVIYSNSTKLASGDLDLIWSKLNDETSVSIDSILDNYKYSVSYSTKTQNYKEDGSLDGDPVYGSATLERGLSNLQKLAIKNEFNSQRAKLASEASLGTTDYVISTYNGKYVVDNTADLNDLTTSFTNSKNELQGMINDLNAEKTRLFDMKDSLDKKISSLNGSINDLKLNPLPALVSANGSYVFEDINIKPAKITIKGLSELSGNGSFKTFNSGLKIDNYSSRDLVFKNIFFETGSGDGLNINGVAYNAPGRVAYPNLSSHGVQRVYDNTADNNINISTYYDHNNPTDLSSVISNTVFDGIVKNNQANRVINVFNDSGNISFKNYIQTGLGDVIASQGNVNIASKGDVALTAGKTIVAGKDVNITANKFTNNGSVNAGNPDRSIVIDDSMYDLLSLNSDGVNNMPKTKKSTYLNASDNIKAIKDTDGNIHIYNTEATSGSINVNAIKAGSGGYSYSDGYGSVNIVNNTNHNVIVHNILNNHKAGSSNLPAINKGFASASTSITSNNSNLNIKGLVSSGNLGSANNGDGLLSVSAKTLKVSERLSGVDKAENIDATGTVTVKSTDGLSLLGWIKNRAGSTSITNQSSGALNVSGLVSNNGALSISNAGTDLSISGVVEKQGTEGDLTIANTGTGKLDISGKVTNAKNNMTITNANASSSGIEISGKVENQSGELEIANNDSTEAGGLVVTETGNVSNVGGKLALKNPKGKLWIKKNADNNFVNVKNMGGNLEISNAGTDLSISGVVEKQGTEGDLTITNTGTGKLDISGKVTNAKNNMSITNANASSSGIEISGKVENQSGELEIANNESTEAGGLVVTETGNVSNVGGKLALKNPKGKLWIKKNADNNFVNVKNMGGNLEISNAGTDLSISGVVEKQGTAGDLTIANTGTGKLDISGKVTNAKNNMSITNANASSSGIEVSGKVENQSGELEIANNDSTEAGGLVVTETGNVSNVGGKLALKNPKGKLWIKKNADNNFVNVKNMGGNLEISNAGTDLSISGVVEKQGTAGDLTIANTGTGKLDISGKVTNAKNNMTITNANGSSLGIEISGKVENQSGELEIANNNSTEAGGLVVTETGNVSNVGGKLALKNQKGKLWIKKNADDNFVNVKNMGGNLEISNAGTDLSISGVVEKQGTEGDLTIANTGTGKLDISGKVTNAKNNMSITNANASSSGIEISGKVENQSGELEIANNNSTEAGGLVVTETGNVSNVGGKLALKNPKGKLWIKKNADNNFVNVKNMGGNLEISNAGTGGIDIDGKVEKNGTGDLLSITNTGVGSIDISGSVKNATNKFEILNDYAASSGIIISGIVDNINGSLDIFNLTETGLLGVVISGVVQNNEGDLKVLNNLSDIIVTGTVKNTGIGGLALKNNATAGAISLDGAKVTNSNGRLSIHNNGMDKIELVGTTEVQNNGGTLLISNAGVNGIDIKDVSTVSNSGGREISITNRSDAGTSGILFDRGTKVINHNGTVVVQNVGKRQKGIEVKGVITAQDDVDITNQDSDIVIGDSTSTNGNNAQNTGYIAAGSDVIINQQRGNILNGIYQNDEFGNHSNYDIGQSDNTYQTLISSGGNLSIDVKDGDIGHTDNSRPGFSIDAKTRNYTDSINVNVSGNITASAKNESKTNDRLINLRSRFSDMKLNNIEADGNVILTAADWRQADQTIPNKLDGAYYNGYSILNSTGSDIAPNVEAKNISLISSKNINLNLKQNNPVILNPTASNWVSFEAENNVNINDVGTDSMNIWQAIAKRGNMSLVLGGDDVLIRAITSGDNLHIVNKGKKLTIYDLGIIPDVVGNFKDMLYPHDKLSLTGSDRVVPKSIQLEVLDMRGGNSSASVLNIYNAYLKGRDLDDQTPSDMNGILPFVTGLLASDVTIKADNLIAHSANAPSSVVSTSTNPNGFNNVNSDRFYYDDPILGTGSLNAASGFNSYAAGDAISFDLRGVSPELVALYSRGQANRTNYLNQPVITTLQVFTNPLYIPAPGYKMDKVSLTLNNYNAVPTENRGLLIDRLYSNDAYVNTGDLNLRVVDAVIGKYAEFKNGNRGGSGSYSGPSRWTTVVDNEFRRKIDEVYKNYYVTLQIYTQKTGSFGLYMGNLIVMETKAPPVFYNPYEVTNLTSNENSFYRQTYKDDKIQETTTTPEFKDLDKSTNAQTKRDSLRFESGEISVNTKGAENNMQVYNVSKTGMELENSTNAKVGDKISLDIQLEDVKINVDAEVMRAADGKIGVKFSNLDKATANKILYMNMMSIKAKSKQLSSR